MRGSKTCGGKSASDRRHGTVAFRVFVPLGWRGSGCWYCRSRCLAAARGRSSSAHVTPETGITFQHTDGSSGRHYIVESVASGLATFDYDGDGLIDIYFLNGRPLPGAAAERPPANALYRNLGGFRFRDVTAEAGVGGAGYGLGVAVGRLRPRRATPTCT